MPSELIPATGPQHGAALILHSWWGLTPSFKQIGQSLAQHGIAVCLTDLFDGHIATTEPEARKLRSAKRKEPMYRTLLRDLDHLMDHSGCQRPGVVGFSMGAHWAVWLSQQPANKVRSVVLYYGARGGNFSASNAAYLAHFAKDDPWVSASVRRGMERAIKGAGCAYTAHDYPGTGHWFAESDRPDSYDARAAALALKRTITHLKTPHSGITAQ